MTDGQLSAAKAFIREGKPVVVMQGDRATPATVRFRFMRGAEEAGAVELGWPRSFRHKGDASGIGRATLQDTDAFQPYTEVKVEVDGQPVKPQADWGLTRLYALNDDDFEGIFFRARDRTPDKETQHFATRQITHFYTLNASHRAVAAVIQGYRAIDLGRPELTEAAIAAVRKELETAHELPESWRARLDGVHLTASLRSVLWQILLFRDEGAAMIRELDILVDYLKSAVDPLPYIAINGCPAILVRAHMLLAEGRRDEAAELGFWNADFYLGCLTRLKKRRKFWQELVPPYRLAMTSIDLAERIVDQVDEPLSDETVIVEAMRVESDQPSARVMVRNYEALVATLRAGGAPAGA
jgi:hypothetical protein